MILNIFKKV